MIYPLIVSDLKGNRSHNGITSSADTSEIALIFFFQLSLTSWVKSIHDCSVNVRHCLIRFKELQWLYYFGEKLQFIFCRFTHLQQM